jgi:hypothetical protein
MIPDLDVWSSFGQMVDDANDSVVSRRTQTDNGAAFDEFYE